MALYGLFMVVMSHTSFDSIESQRYLRNVVVSLSFYLAFLAKTCRFWRQTADKHVKIYRTSRDEHWEQAQSLARAADFWRLKAIRLSEQSGIPIQTIWDGNEPKLPVKGERG